MQVFMAEDADSAKRKDAMELIRLTTLQPEGLDVLLPSAVAFAIANAPGAKISEEEAARLAREVILSDAFLEKFTPPFEEIFSHEEIRDLMEDEILVAPTTSPSWAPAFAKIKACITDVGGVMSHAAIVCREYGMPAVVGTGYATKVIKSGMSLRVDGSSGHITIVR